MLPRVTEVAVDQARRYKGPKRSRGLSVKHIDMCDPCAGANGGGFRSYPRPGTVVICEVCASPIEGPNRCVVAP